ncbi:phosphate acyltransferase PlsX [Nannocystaceae bacterium ST9]
MPRIALDAFGSDRRPEPELAALALAIAGGLEIDLVGDRRRLADRLPSDERLALIHASEQIAMDESPARAVKGKPDASLNVALARLAAGEVGAVVSAGNSGAILAAALLGLGRIAGVDRPAILTRFPHLAGNTVVLDAGANVDCRPLNLVQFAVMGSVFARLEHGCVRPRVGLLSNGSEPGKGTPLTRATAKLLAAHPSAAFDYVGYVEPGDLFEGACEVAVTDGWTGNLVLKASEGAMSVWPRFLARAIAEDPSALAALRSSLRTLADELDPDAQGGAPLIGVDGTVIICHGAASPRALYNALMLAQRSATRGLTPALHEAITGHRPLFDAARGP